MPLEIIMEINQFFEQEKYYVYRNFISKDFAVGLAEQFKMFRNMTMYFTENSKEKFYDSLVTDNCFCWYAPVDHVMTTVQNKVENITGKTLLPTYSFGRIYYKNAVMKEHTDRPSCEYSVTLCASIDNKPWPIWLRNKEGVDIPVDLYPGDALIYKGQMIPHWRNPYTEGNEQVQFFLHWVDKFGNNTEWENDKRLMLGFPAAFSDDGTNR
jgi:hypothetical protein